MVAELNFNSLENIHGWMVVLHGKAYYTGYFTGKVLRYWSIHENRSTLNDLQYTVLASHGRVITIILLLWNVVTLKTGFHKNFHSYNIFFVPNWLYENFLCTKMWYMLPCYIIVLNLICNQHVPGFFFLWGWYVGVSAPEASTN